MYSLPEQALGWFTLDKLLFSFSPSLPPPCAGSVVVSGGSDLTKWKTSVDTRQRCSPFLHHMHRQQLVDMYGALKGLKVFFLDKTTVY